MLNDDPARIWSHRSEIVQRLLADECDLCGSRKPAEVHHIRALKDLNRKGKNHPPEWVTRMAVAFRHHRSRLGRVTSSALGRITSALVESWTAPWTWPVRPPADRGAWICASLVFPAGLLLFTVRGPRARLSDDS